MSGKAALNISVAADTSAASKALRKLDAEVEKMQQKTRRRNKQNKGSDGGIIPDFGGKNGKIPLPDIPGIDKVTSALSKMGIVSKIASGGIGSLVGKVKGMPRALAVGFAAIGYVVKGLVSMTEAGKSAASDFEKINVSLSTLSKNLTGNADTTHLSKSIQLLAAEGVGNLDQLTSAARTLMVAFNGNQGAVQKWLPIMDDVAAGTSLTADQFAQMTARVQASGKIETEVLNMLRDRGVPVYKLLGKQLGITGEAAQDMAKKGELGMSHWMALVEEMHKSYKGLSAELSNNTMQGAIDTYAAMRSMAFQAATDAANFQKTADLNARSAQYKLDAFDTVTQANLTRAGELVGKVGSWFDRVKDAFSPENVVKVGLNFMSDITGATETAAKNLVMAALSFRQIPNFAGQSSTDIGKYLADATQLYQQMDATLKNNADAISPETADEIRAAMERIRDRIKLAEEANQEATATEQKAAAELAAAEKAAAAAAEEAARAAKKEAEERERHIKKLEEERLANIKDSQEYRRELKERAAQEAAAADAQKGNSAALELSLEALAQAVAGLSLEEAQEKLAELTDKITSGNVEEITAEDKETHKRLEKLIAEVEKLRDTAARTDKKKEEEAERANDATASDEEKAARAVKRELSEFAENLEKAGLTLAEKQKRMDEKMAEIYNRVAGNLVENLDMFNQSSPSGERDYSTDFIAAMDAEAQRSLLLLNMNEKQADAALKANAIAEATLKQLYEFNHFAVTK